ncbi:MAG: hypothetical protein V1898_03500 [Patescibacteria group bacterium]
MNFLDQDFPNEYAKQIMAEANMKDLDEKYLQDYENRLAGLIVSRLQAIATNNISEAGRQEYEKVMADKSLDNETLRAKISEIWQKEIPDYTAVMENGLLEFAKEYLSNFSMFQEPEAEPEIEPEVKPEADNNQTA